MSVVWLESRRPRSSNFGGPNIPCNPKTLYPCFGTCGFCPLECSLLPAAKAVQARVKVVCFGVSGLRVWGSILGVVDGLHRDFTKIGHCGFTFCLTIASPKVHFESLGMQILYENHDKMVHNHLRRIQHRGCPTRPSALFRAK